MIAANENLCRSMKAIRSALKMIAGAAPKHQLEKTPIVVSVSSAKMQEQQEAMKTIPSITQSGMNTSFIGRSRSGSLSLTASKARNVIVGPRQTTHAPMRVITLVQEFSNSMNSSQQGKTQVEPMAMNNGRKTMGHEINSLLVDET